MPIGKDIYNQLGRFESRRQRFHAASKVFVRPPTISQFEKNITSTIKSNSLHILDLAKAGPRNISPNEGMPALNGKSGKEIIKKAVKKIGSKNNTPNPTAGAILPMDTKKNKKGGSRKIASRRCGNCRNEGHTKRNCPEFL